MRIRLLIATALTLGCAGVTEHAHAPRWVRDSRTGLVVRVPDGWSLAPNGLVEASRPSTLAGANRPRVILALIQDAALANGRVVTLLAFARPNPGLPVPGTSPTACSELLARLRTFESRAKGTGTRTIGGREFCAYRSEQPDGHALLGWSTVSGSDVLDLQTLSDVAGANTAIDEAFDAMSFTTPAPLEGHRAGEAAPRINDPQTGLRLDVPAGWSALPRELILASAESTLQSRSSTDQIVFVLVRDETFTTREQDVVAFSWEPLADGAVLPDSQDEICEMMLPFVRSQDARAEPQPPRSIGGWSFCAFRFSSGGQTHLLYVAVRDRFILQLHAAYESPDLAPLEALLDAVEFDRR